MGFNQYTGFPLQSLNEPLIETRDLTKCYGRAVALERCTLQVRRGEVVGLLGPNGAGKTTLVRLLLGFLRPTAGQARIGPWDCHRQAVQVRRLTGYLPGEPRIFGEMRGGEVLRFFAALRGHDTVRAQEVARRLALDTSGRVRTMSTGMRQKLALAVVFSSAAPLLILDEPTSNLDPAARSTVIALVREAQAQGTTVLFSSHVLSEVEEACDRVLMLRRGQLVCDLSLQDLRKRHRVFVSLESDDPAAQQSVFECPQELAPHVVVTRWSNGYRIETDGTLGPLLRWLAGYRIRELHIEATSLRSIYEQYFSASELAE